jgi:hypothetical protein
VAGWGALIGLLVLLAYAPASAQTGSTTGVLTGVVVDSDGGVVPGATVVVTNPSTGFKFETVTNTSGSFSAPALQAGAYTVTISLTGFKTVSLTNVRIIVGRSEQVRATLEIGALTETVEVTGGTEIVQTQSPTISSTIAIEQVKALPMVSRNALNYVVFLPGVQTTGGPRGSTISGLPQDTINITLDGISVSNNLQSGDGFFSLVVPSLDALEQVTVTTAAQGADAGGQGASQIKFVTRSGTNLFSGTVYDYFRHPSLNSNYYFNKINGLERNRVILHQAGGSAGGPIVLPGLVDGRGKAFFFFNYEQFYQPTEVTRSRTMLNPQTQQGLFSYLASGGVQQVDLLSLAAANGFTSTPDPTVAALLAQIQSGAESTGVISARPNAPHLNDYIYQSPARSDRYFPTTKLDFNLSTRHRLSTSYYWQRFNSSPDILNSRDPRFPGLTNFGEQASYRTSGSITLRSTLGSNLVNEVVGGWQWSPVEFFKNVTASQYDSQGGYALNFPNIGGNGIPTDPNHTATPSWRNTSNWSIDNTLSWLRGNHSLSLGGSFQQIFHDQNTTTVASSINFGVNTNNDPANAMFTTANFPGASTGTLNNARALYGLLTGRVTSITGTGRLDGETNQYVYNGFLNRQSRMREFGIYAQDSWRMTPTFTLNAGVRWQVVLPFVPITDNWTMSTIEDLCGISGLGDGPEGRACNIFRPGHIGNPGILPTYVPYDPGQPGYVTDWDNLAPNIGAAWRPNVQGGWLRALLGDPEQATLRGGYSVSYSRPRMDEFTGLFGNNPGGTINLNRTATASGTPLVLPGESWPVLFRDRDRLSPPDFDATPQFPLTASLGAGNDIRVFDPDLEIASTRSWTLSFQRALSRDMAVDIRYVGNRLMDDWSDENWNELSIFENGFIDEFQLAQQNLLANIAAGRGNNFRYFGPGTGTSPLPTYLAFFSGVPFAEAGNPALYTSGLFANTGWTGHLGQYEPDPYDAANDLWNNSGRRANALAAAVPLNWFVMNPHVDDAIVNVGRAGSKYHSLQIEVRRRLSGGLDVQGSYVYAKRYGTSLQRLRPRLFLQSAGVPHAFKMSWTYELPFGRGRRFGTDMNPILNGVVGNWVFSGTGRFQVRDFTLNNARLVGMTESELQDAFKIRVVNDPLGGLTTVWNMPEDIIENTRRAYDTNPTSPDGYGSEGPPTGRYIAPMSQPGCIYLFTGDCGQQQIRVKGSWFQRVDVRFKKRFPFSQRGSFDLDVEVLNLFDNINFENELNPGSGSGVFRVDQAYRDINTTQDPGGRLGQIVFRVNF